MMRDLREKTKIVMILVALAFVGLMVFQWGMDITGTSVASQTGELGRVNGEPVSYQAYSTVYQTLYDQARAQAGTTQLSAQQIDNIEDQAFNQVVNDILMQQEMRRRGITVSDREIVQASRWMPHPDLMQNELFQTNGEFDINKYQQFLSSPAANEQLLMELEQYYRSTIPRSKLLRQVTAGLYVGDTELWQMWRDQNETAVADYVPLNISVLVPGDVEVTDNEVSDYYDAHPDDFNRTATGRFTLAFIPKSMTPADSAAALATAQQLREEIVGGTDFATVAQRESDDAGSAAAGGDLGTFGRGTMVPEFEEAAFSLPIGEISQPVKTQYGYHLIQVQERTDSTVSARHILIAFEPTDESLDRMYARADSLETVTDAAGIERAASVLGATLRQGVVASMESNYVPGVGSILEAVEWARDEQTAEEPVDNSGVLETPEAFYIVKLEQYIEPGKIPLEEASSEIRRQIILEKKREQAREIGQTIVQEVRAGKSLEDAASERGLTVQTTGEITRAGFNPAFGQANAATGAAFGVPVGEVSDVVSTPNGLFIVRPKSRTPADREEFETRKDQLRQLAMTQMQQNAISQWIAGLRSQANILDRRDVMLVPTS